MSTCVFFFKTSLERFDNVFIFLLRSVINLRHLKRCRQDVAITPSLIVPEGLQIANVCGLVV